MYVHESAVCHGDSVGIISIHYIDGTTSNEWEFMWVGYLSASLNARIRNISLHYTAQNNVRKGYINFNQSIDPQKTDHY